LGFEPVSDTAALVEIVRRAVAANPKAVADFKKGKTKAADAIKGAVMRETKGMAKTEDVQQLLMEELQKGGGRGISDPRRPPTRTSGRARSRGTRPLGTSACNHLNRIRLFSYNWRADCSSNTLPPKTK